MIGASTTSPRTSARPSAERGRTAAALAVTLRLAFAALLLVTGVAKLVDLPGFVAVVGTYRALPEALLAPAAALLTAAELALGAWLLSGRRLAEAALATALLHLGYFAWLAVAHARGLDIPNCGCFGVFWARPLTAWTFVEDGTLLALALALLALARRRTAPA
jgi:hypothetical protein